MYLLIYLASSLLEILKYKEVLVFQYMMTYKNQILFWLHFFERFLINQYLKPGLDLESQGVIAPGGRGRNYSLGRQILFFVFDHNKLDCFLNSQFIFRRVLLFLFHCNSFLFSFLKKIFGTVVKIYLAPSGQTA